MDQTHKIVLITGGSAGIGKVTAEMLYKQGYKVAIAARTMSKLAEVTKHFPEMFAVEVDMTLPESIQQMVTKVIDHYGQLDILINNAGQGLRAPVTDVKLADFEYIMKLNVYGPLLALQAVIPQMKIQGRGQIINVSSNVSKMAIPGLGAYAATKYALNGLMLTARNELAEHNISVSLMHPRLTATEFANNALSYTNSTFQPIPNFTERDSPEAVALKILEAIKNNPAEQFMT